MNKRNGLAIVGAAVVGAAIVAAVAWLTTGANEHETETVQALPASVPASETPGPAQGPPATNRNSADIAAARPTVSAGAPVDTLPIDVSPGFEYLNKPAGEMKDTHPMWPQWRRHQELQSEPRDEAWAPRIEAAVRRVIQDSLMAQGLDTERIELSVIECRTNGCEIQAVGYPEDNLRQGVDLQSIMFTMLAGSMGDEFDRDALNMSMTSRPDNRLGFLVQLPRRKK